MIKAEIVAHSLSPQGDELISVLATFPRIILAEVNTHRMLSKNTSSSRAIPFNKMVESVKTNPFIPIAWQKQHSGMQGNEYFEPEFEEYDNLVANWLMTRDQAITSASVLNQIGLTKQLSNRLLEPFMWTTMLITGSKEGWQNFFNLRCPNYVFHDDKDEYHFKSKKDVIKHFGESEWVEDEFDKPLKNLTELDWLKLNYGQAEIHMMMLAEKIYDAINESNSTQILPTMWHVPFRRKINELYPEVENDSENIVKISVSMAARASYTIVGESKVLTKEEHISLHDRLIAQDPPHSSPLEHCARVMTDDEYERFVKGYLDHDVIAWSTPIPIASENSQGWCNNFKGFIPYRYLVDNKIDI